MTTDVDITNRALQLIGTQTTITSLGEASNEAIQANLVYNAIRDWCLGIANWNFARATTALTLAKTSTGAQPWTNAQPTPPWKYEYKLPTDCIISRYLTGDTTVAGDYVGEPQRYVIASDTITAVQQSVLLTNQVNAVLIYTARITDPTLWPWLFERLMVSNLAATLGFTLTGDFALIQQLTQINNYYISAGVQANLIEGLRPDDSTPEWIQAIGMDYPLRRRAKTPTQGSGNADGR